MAQSKPTARIIVVGSGGRMGQEVLACAEQSKNAEVFAAVDPSGSAGTHRRLQDINLPAKASRGKTVVVEFSNRTGFSQTLKWCVKNGVPLVSGTTGLSAGQRRSLHAASRKIPVLWSSNMSFGINIMTQIIETFAAVLAQYDLQLEEFHHRRKIDHPSGTAISLQAALSAATKRKLPPPMSGRGGGIFGIHKLWVMAEEETLTIEHTALNRRVFARGAVTAAVWLSHKKSGFYNVRDLWKTSVK